ncbi:MAG TPA: hypothetical protein VGF79_08045 [Bacteroidia bacterium]
MSFKTILYLFGILILSACNKEVIFKANSNNKITEGISQSDRTYSVTEVGGPFKNAFYFEINSKMNHPNYRGMEFKLTDSITKEVNAVLKIYRLKRTNDTGYIFKDGTYPCNSLLTDSTFATVDLFCIKENYARTYKSISSVPNGTVVVSHQNGKCILDIQCNMNGQNPSIKPLKAKGRLVFKE